MLPEAMATPIEDVQRSAESILSILYPLLTSPDDATIRSIIASLRSTPVSPPVLVNSLYIFCKLLPSNQDDPKRLTHHQTAFRSLLTNLTHSAVLSHSLIYEAFDTESLSTYVDPSINHSLEQKRVRTRLWFTQTRFNLFREESEGYTKVISLLWLAMHPDPPSAEIIIKKLIVLIGHFSLDSNRIIELILSAASDVVGDLIARSHAFPNDTRLPPIFSRLLDEFARDHVFNVVGAMFQSFHTAFENSSPPDSSRTPTELPVTDSDKKPLRSFLGLVAVLIREGRMAVTDIWHHLSPRNNSHIFEDFLEYETKLVELTKTVCSPPKTPPENGEDDGKHPHFGIGASDRDVWSQYRFLSQGPISRVQHQKLELITQLIGMCRWRDAMSAILLLSIDGENVDVAAVPHIAVSIASLVEFLLNPVMNSTFPSSYPERTRITDAIEKLGGRANGYPSPVRTIDQFLSTDPNAPGMYVREMLQILGPYSRVSIRLLYALCRLLKGRKELEAINIMRDVVLPAASLIQSNAGLSNAIWDVLKCWSHVDRWMIYGHLHNEVSATCAVYHVIAQRASYEVRYILKRLTSETQHHHTNAFAKITHGQALAAFSATFDRIQGYPADLVTITPIVESCVSCTDLSLDMLIFLVLDRMADSKRNRLKEDGINVAQWYSTMSLFLGLCLRKLPLTSHHMDGVVSFLGVKLVMEPEALLITALSDIIKSVADIEVDINLTSKQIAAQGGGPLLQKVVSGAWGRLQPDLALIGTSFDNRVERERRRAMQSLHTSFVKDGAHAWISVSIAQLTRSAVFDEDLKSMPLKLSANIVDRARSSLIQLSQFLEAVPKGCQVPEIVSKSIWDPLKAIGISALLNEMNVPTSSAIILMSPTLDFLTTPWDLSLGWGQGDNMGSTAGSPNTSEPRKFIESRGSMASTMQTKSGEAGKAATESQLATGMSQRVPIVGNAAGNMECEVDGRKNPVFDEKEFSYILSSRTSKLLTPQLTFAFWTLKLNDIAVPTQLYETERKRMRSVKLAWEKEHERYRRHAHGDTDRARRCENELRLIRDCTDSLIREEGTAVRRQKAVYDKIRLMRSGLRSPAANGTPSERKKSASFFLQECVFPRSRVSVPDALFCAKFVLILLDLDIPAFPYKEYFESLVKLIPALLRSCSENEALGLSRLLKETLYSLEKWRSNKTIFESEISIASLSGLQYFKDGESKHFQHEEYCQWLFEIHRSLTEGICRAVVHHEYLYSRNCLTVLAGVAEVFPKVSAHSSKIEKCVSELTKSDLADIRLSSSSVLARLRSGKIKRIPEHIFRLRPYPSNIPGGRVGKTAQPSSRQKPSHVQESAVITKVDESTALGTRSQPGADNLASRVRPADTENKSLNSRDLSKGQDAAYSGKDHSGTAVSQGNVTKGTALDVETRQTSEATVRITTASVGKRTRDCAGQWENGDAPKVARLATSKSPGGGSSGGAPRSDPVVTESAGLVSSGEGRDGMKGGFDGSGVNRKSDNAHPITRGQSHTEKNAKYDVSAVVSLQKGNGADDVRGEPATGKMGASEVERNFEENTFRGERVEPGDSRGVSASKANPKQSVTGEASKVLGVTNVVEGSVGVKVGDGAGVTGDGYGVVVQGGNERRGMAPMKPTASVRALPRLQQDIRHGDGDRSSLGRKRSFNELNAGRDGDGDAIVASIGRSNVARLRDTIGGGLEGRVRRDHDGGGADGGHSDGLGRASKRRRDNNMEGGRNNLHNVDGRRGGRGLGDGADQDRNINHRGHDGNRHGQSIEPTRGESGPGYVQNSGFSGGQSNVSAWVGRHDMGNNEGRHRDDADVRWQVRARDDGRGGASGGMITNPLSERRWGDRRDHRDRDAMERGERDRRDERDRDMRDQRDRDRDRDRGRDRDRRRHNGGGRRRRNGGH